MKKIDTKFVEFLKNNFSTGYTYFYNYSGKLPNSFGRQLIDCTLMLLYSSDGGAYIIAFKDEVYYEIGMIPFNVAFTKALSDYFINEKSPKKD